MPFWRWIFAVCLLAALGACGGATHPTVAGNAGTGGVALDPGPPDAGPVDAIQQDAPSGDGPDAALADLSPGDTDDGPPATHTGLDSAADQAAADASIDTDADAGTGTPEVCSFTITGALSPMISTVGVIAWAVDLPGLTAARLEFSLNDPRPGELNVGGAAAISVTDRHALMLGLKPGRSYTYRIVATAGPTVCASADQVLATQADPTAPAVTRVAGDAVATRARGFIVTCAYGGRYALIIDTDGVVVWWTAAPPSCTRAHMDWDGTSMWMMAANASTGGVAGGNSGDVRRVRMDGSGLEKLSGLERSHHDLAVLPGGGAAFLVVGDTGDTNLVERDPDGTMRPVATLNSALYGASGGHPNALRYQAGDDSYTISDLHLPGIVKLNRQGSLQWRAGGTSSAASSPCSDMSGVHGHQLLDSGNLLFFKANYGGSSLDDPSPVCEYSFVESGGMRMAALAWSYAGSYSSLILGDVQRLPNSDTLITYSTIGTIAEVTPAGALAQALMYPSGQFGYSTFRESLYGPAP